MAEFFLLRAGKGDAAGIWLRIKFYRALILIIKLDIRLPFLVKGQFRPALHEIKHFSAGLAECIEEGGGLCQGVSIKFPKTEAVQSGVIPQRHVQQGVAFQLIEDDRIGISVIITNIKLSIELTHIQRTVVVIYRSILTSDSNIIFQSAAVGPPGYLIMPLKPVRQMF